MSATDYNQIANEEYYHSTYANHFRLKDVAVPDTHKCSRSVSQWRHARQLLNNIPSRFAFLQAIYLQSRNHWFHATHLIVYLAYLLSFGLNFLMKRTDDYIHPDNPTHRIQLHFLHKLKPAKNKILSSYLLHLTCRQFLERYDCSIRVVLDDTQHWLSTTNSPLRYILLNYFHATRWIHEPYFRCYFQHQPFNPSQSTLSALQNSRTLPPFAEVL